VVTLQLLSKQCHYAIVVGIIIRSPGTVVPEGLMFYNSRGDGDGDDHVVPDAGQSVSCMARAGSAGGKRLSELRSRTVER